MHYDQTPHEYHPQNPAIKCIHYFFFISNTLKIFQFVFYIYIKTHKYVSKLLKSMIHVTPTETPNFSRPLEFMRAPAPLHQQSKSSLSGKQLK